MQPSSDTPPFPQDVLQRLKANATSVTLKTGETLFEQEDFDDRLYIVEDGVLEVSVIAANGRKLALNQLRAGDVFGEIAVFDPGPRTAGVSALSPCRLHAIGHGVLLRMMQSDAELIAQFLGLAGRRMRWMSQQMEDQVFLPPAVRLAAKLLHLAGETGEVRMSQAQLADYVGVTREMVSKTLSDWRRDGLVSLSRGKIAVLDADGLEEMKDGVFF